CERATSDCAKRPVKARTISNQRRPQITSPAAPPKKSSTESPLGSRMCLVGTDHGFLSRLVGRDGTIFSALGEPDLFTSTHLAIRGEGRATFRASVNGDFSIALSCWRPGILKRSSLDIFDSPDRVAKHRHWYSARTAAAQFRCGELSVAAPATAREK